jgi:XTP/dITP diphosphohydrolase
VTTRLVLATRNVGKVAELRRILGDAGLDVDLVGMDAYPEAPDVPETGATFAENALIKARAAVEYTGLPAIADDSGLCVDALNQMPGVLSARWAGAHGDDEANLRLVLSQLGDVPDERLGAGFACAAAIALPDGREQVTEGHMRGHLVREPRGSGGFGYDPILVADDAADGPDGRRRTTAELGPGEKDAISHRGRAFRALAPVVAQLLA